MSMMTVRDLEQVQTAFTEAGLDYQLELENGKISIRDGAFHHRDRVQSW